MALFDRLGFNFPQQTSTTVTEFPSGTISYLKSVPTILEQWQVNDLANTMVDTSSAANYHVNPVANITNSIVSICSALVSTCGSANNLQDIVSNANILISNTSVSYKSFTNLMSGVTPPDTNNPAQSSANMMSIRINTTTSSDKMSYEKAISTSKFLTTVLYQTDGISNTSVSVGNFTSLYIKDNLSNSYNLLVSDSATVNASNIYYDSVYSRWTSNVSSTTANSIVGHIQTVINLMNERRYHDINFYNESQQLAKEIREMKKFSGSGQVERNMYSSVGNDQIKSLYQPGNV